MQLTLKCRDEKGSVAFPAESIDGLPAPERRYSIENHQVILDGPDFIVHHDADELLSMPNGLFRMLTPAEQDELSMAAQQAAMAQESVPADLAPPALPDLSSTDQPKKKASGG